MAFFLTLISSLYAFISVLVFSTRLPSPATSSSKSSTIYGQLTSNVSNFIDLSIDICKSYSALKRSSTEISFFCHAYI